MRHVCVVFIRTDNVALRIYPVYSGCHNSRIIVDLVHVDWDEIPDGPGGVIAVRYKAKPPVRPLVPIGANNQTLIVDTKNANHDVFTGIRISSGGWHGYSLSAPDIKRRCRTVAVERDITM